MAADTMGLRGKATAMPVVSSRVGAAVAAEAIDIHGVWLVSVNNMPEKPWSATSRASWALAAHVDGPTIRSNRMRAHFRLVVLVGAGCARTSPDRRVRAGH